MAETVFINSQEFSVDGVTYSISVYHSADGYMAFCDCHRCSSHNMRSPHMPSPEAATKECEQLIRDHHDGCHGAGCSTG